MAAINATTWAVVAENQRRALYSADADSIAIPIFNTALASLPVLPFLVLLSWLPEAPFLGGPRGRRSIGMNVLLLAAYVPAVLFALGGVAYWGLPNHYSIACGYAALLLLLVLFAALEVRRMLAGR